MKTLDIFKKYEALYNEADDLELNSPETPDATDIAEQPPEPVSAEGEKFLADLLIKAFLHEPDDNGAQAAIDLESKVDENPKDVISTIKSMVVIGPEGGIKDNLAEIDS